MLGLGGLMGGGKISAMKASSMKAIKNLNILYFWK